MIPDNKFICPHCGSSMFRVVVDALLVIDMDAESIINIHSEALNREGEIICDDCNNTIPASEALWEEIETIYCTPEVALDE